MPEVLSKAMSFRGLCKHGKVRMMIVEPDEKSSPAWRKEFKAELGKMKRWAHTVDYVTVEEARKSDISCAVCDKSK